MASVLAPLLASHACRVAGSSPVAVSGQQCSQEVPPAQPTSPGPLGPEGCQPSARPQVGVLSIPAGPSYTSPAAVEKWLWGRVFSVPHHCYVISVDSALTHASPADLLVTVPCLGGNV